MELDFEIDKITESIENAETGETLDTLVLPIIKNDLKEVNNKNGWLFLKLNGSYTNLLPRKSRKLYTVWYRLKRWKVMCLCT